MKILILEDNPERIEKFKILFQNQKLFIFDNVLDAHNVCICNEFPVMFLDHDLDARMWVNSEEENTGYQFVKLLVSNDIQKNSLIYIHSSNPIGANQMLNYLKDNGYDGIWYPYQQWKFL
jgi:hypothetical protein